MTVQIAFTITTPAYEEKMEALLEYGAMAQKYFDYNTENLASETVPTGLASVAETAVYDTDHAHAEEFEGAPYYGVSLILRNKITLRFYYKSVEGYVHTDNVLQYSELNNAMPYCVLAVNNPESSEDLINLCYALSNLYDAFN